MGVLPGDVLLYKDTSFYNKKQGKERNIVSNIYGGVNSFTYFSFINYITFSGQADVNDDSKEYLGSVNLGC